MYTENVILNKYLTPDGILYGKAVEESPTLSKFTHNVWKRYDYRLHIICLVA